ncbi:methyltransferase domain-containing protein [Chloroflexota bacterium]
MLQVGAGTNSLEGWLNTDQCPVNNRVVYMDAIQPFPFKDNTFEYVFSEHQIEHLSYEEGLFMLGECYRILKPGGKIRIATPDLETLICLFTPDKSDIQKKYIDWVVARWLPHATVKKECFVINNAFRHWWHKFIYDRETLRHALESVGFANLKYYDPGESDDETLRGIESHGIAIDNEEINRFETMVLEGERPIMDSN